MHRVLETYPPQETCLGCCCIRWGTNFLWSSLMKVWKSTAKFIWTWWRKRFFLDSQKLLRTNACLNRTVVKLSYCIWPRSCARFSSDAFRTSNCYQVYFRNGCFNLFPSQFGLTEGSRSISLDQVEQGMGWDFLALRWRPVSDSWSKHETAISKFCLFILFSIYFWKLV